MGGLRLKGLTTDAGTARGLVNPKSGKKKGDGPPFQNLSSLRLLEVHEVLETFKSGARIFAWVSLTIF